MICLQGTKFIQQLVVARVITLVNHIKLKKVLLSASGDQREDFVIKHVLISVHSTNKTYTTNKI